MQAAATASLRRTSTTLLRPAKGAIAPPLMRSRVLARNASASTKEASELDNPTPVAAPTPTSSRVKSAAPAGTVLKGIQFHAGKPDPVALPDEEYPSWLWKLLDEPASAVSSASASQKKASRPGQKIQVTIKGQKVIMDKKELRRKNVESIRSSNFLKAQ